jgi:hypothetical protein
LKTNAACYSAAFLFGNDLPFFGEPVGGGRKLFVAVYEAVLLKVVDNRGRYIFGFAFKGVELEEFAAVEVAVGLEEMTGRHGL